MAAENNYENGENKLKQGSPLASVHGSGMHCPLMYTHRDICNVF